MQRAILAVGISLAALVAAGCEDEHAERTVAYDQPAGYYEPAPYYGPYYAPYYAPGDYYEPAPHYPREGRFEHRSDDGRRFSHPQRDLDGRPAGAQLEPWHR